MARFRKDIDEAKLEDFREQDQRRRVSNHDFSDPWLTCVVCGSQMRQSEAERLGLEVCPNCGTDKPATVSNLPYDPKFANRPKPSLQEALQTERANRAMLRRPNDRI